MLTYVLTFEEASAAEPCLEQLCNMRRQLESKAREDRMYQMKNPNWIGALHPNRQLISLSPHSSLSRACPRRLARRPADEGQVPGSVRCAPAEHAAEPTGQVPSGRARTHVHVDHATR